MSKAVIDKFTSKDNIDYLKYYIHTKFEDCIAKTQVLDTLLETVHSFNIPYDPCNISRTIDVWKEVKKANCLFIRDRISFIKSYSEIGIDDYSMQMFMADSLYPTGYESINKPVCQVVNRKNIDHNIDELQDSEGFKLRRPI